MGDGADSKGWDGVISRGIGMSRFDLAESIVRSVADAEDVAGVSIRDSVDGFDTGFD